MFISLSDGYSFSNAVLCKKHMLSGLKKQTCPISRDHLKHSHENSDHISEAHGGYFNSAVVEMQLYNADGLN